MINQIVSILNSNDYYRNCIISNNAYNKGVLKDVSFSNCVFSSVYYTFDNCKFNKCIFNDYIHDNQYIDCIFKKCIFEVEQNLDKINDPYTNLLCEGDIIGYKKADAKNSYSKVIVKLLIPAKAKRLNGYSNKCRAEYAKVLEIYDMDGNISKQRVGISLYDEETAYIKNRIVRPDSFDDSKEVCSNGIHFFRTFKEAVDYV